MTFTTKSGLAIIWAEHVRKGKKTIDEVPKIYNLPDVVKELVEGASE